MRRDCGLPHGVALVALHAELVAMIAGRLGLEVAAELCARAWTMLEEVRAGRGSARRAASGGTDAAMLTISSNIDEVLSALDDFEKVQIPFAVAMALNDVAAEVEIAEKTAIQAQLEKPTAFTQRGIYKTRASKRSLSVEIGVRPIQGGYLVWQVAGGVRGPRRRAIPVPFGIVKNSAGNMPKGALAKLLQQPDVFIASAGSPQTKHLPPGIYKRGQRGYRKRRGSFHHNGYGTVGNNWQGKGKSRSTLKLMVAFEDSATYQANTLDFFGVGRKKVETVWRKAFEQRLIEALATSK